MMHPQLPDLLPGSGSLFWAVAMLVLPKTRNSVLWCGAGNSVVLHTRSPCACVLGTLGPHEAPLARAPVIACHTHCPGIGELTN